MAHQYTPIGPDPEAGHANQAAEDDDDDDKPAQLHNPSVIKFIALLAIVFLACAFFVTFVTPFVPTATCMLGYFGNYPWPYIATYDATIAGCGVVEPRMLAPVQALECCGAIAPGSIVPTFNGMLTAVSALCWALIIGISVVAVGSVGGAIVWAIAAWIWQHRVGIIKTIAMAIVLGGTFVAAGYVLALAFVLIMS